SIHRREHPRRERGAPASATSAAPSLGVRDPKVTFDSRVARLWGGRRQASSLLDGHRDPVLPPVAARCHSRSIHTGVLAYRSTVTSWRGAEIGESGPLARSPATTVMLAPSLAATSSRADLVAAMVTSRT